jgi:hypothetical protein
MVFSARRYLQLKASTKIIIQVIHEEIPYPALRERVLPIQGNKLPPQSLQLWQ